jgi:hypothetical protein
MVRREATLAEVVPIATKSPAVVCLTNVPKSVHPPAELPAVQERVPDPSVWRKPFAVWEEGQVYVWVLKVVLPVMARVEEPVIGPEELREPETKREFWIVEEAWEKSPAWAVSSPPNVPVEEAVKRLEIARSPEWNVKAEKVEEAEERKPPERVASPATERVLPSWAVPEAVKVLAVLREPEVKRLEAIVEEAEERKPPERVEREVTPSVEERVAAPLIWIVEEEVIGPEELREPETKRELAKVEEALA